MRASVFPGAVGTSEALEILWADSDRAFCRLPRGESGGHRYAFVPADSDSEHPALGSIERLVHEYELRDHLDEGWALRPADLVRERGRTLLVVAYESGEPLDRLAGAPLEIGLFLRLAV